MVDVSPLDARAVAPLVVGRYAIYGEIASGGMATVHLARLLGPAGFAKTVVVKRLLPHLVRDKEFSLMLIDEARLAARIRHPKAISTLDVITTEAELLLVMEYVHGDSLAKLVQHAEAHGERIPIPIAAAIVCDALYGLEAAHNATAEDGTPLNLIHRDVSPQNVMVGVDGIARIADFGIAKAFGRSHVTRAGAVKGKLSYMAPEQIRMEPLSRRTDVFAAAIVFWELLTGERLFAGENDAQIIHKLLTRSIPLPSMIQRGLPSGLDDVLYRGLARDPEARFATAREMASAIESCVPAVRCSEIGAWVERVAARSLAERAQAILAAERNELVEVELKTAQKRAEQLFGKAQFIELMTQPFESDKLSERGKNSGPGMITDKSVSWARESSFQMEQGQRTAPLIRPALNANTVSEEAKPASSRRWTLLAAATGVLVAGSLIVASRAAAPRSGGVQPAMPVPSAASENVSTTASPELDGGVSDASVSEAPLPPVSSSAPPVISVRKPAPRPPKAQSAPKPAPAPKANCDPPYSLDANGRRIFKIECL